MDPAIATVVSTTLGRDQRMGIIHVSTVTTSMDILNLGGPPITVGCQGVTVDELAEDLADDPPNCICIYVLLPYLWENCVHNSCSLKFKLWLLLKSHIVHCCMLYLTQVFTHLCNIFV